MKEVRSQRGEEVEEVTEVEQVDRRFSSPLQFSTLVELQLENVVRPCVRNQNYHTSHHRISKIFGRKLDKNKLRKLTEPDFPGKIRIIQ